jgi:hypothetical protein
VPIGCTGSTKAASTAARARRPNTRAAIDATCTLTRHAGRPEQANAGRAALFRRGAAAVPLASNASASAGALIRQTVCRLRLGSGQILRSRVMFAFPPIADSSRILRHFRNGPMLSKKSFSGFNQDFRGTLARRSKVYVGGHTIGPILNWQPSEALCEVVDCRIAVSTGAQRKISFSPFLRFSTVPAKTRHQPGY